MDVPTKLVKGDEFQLQIHPQFTRHIVLQIFIVLIASILVVFVVNVVTKPMIQSLSCQTSDPACRNSKRIQTITVVVRSIVVAIIVVAAIAIILQMVGVNVGSILVAAGIGGIIIGLGAQSVIRDVINGVTIISENQVSEGDYITVNFPRSENISGIVQEMSVRVITLKTNNGSIVFVPNGNISHITNHSRQDRTVAVNVYIENEVNPDQILEAISSLMLQLGKYPLYVNKYTMLPRVVGITSSEKTGYTVTVQAASSPDDANDIENFIRTRILSLLNQYKINNNTVDVEMRQVSSTADMNGVNVGSVNVGATNSSGGNELKLRSIVPIPIPNKL